LYFLKYFVRLRFAYPFIERASFAATAFVPAKPAVTADGNMSGSGTGLSARNRQAFSRGRK
jgi:hypothetical protein